MLKPKPITAQGENYCDWLRPVVLRVKKADKQHQQHLGNLLVMQIFGLHPRPTELESLGVRLSYFHEASWWVMLVHTEVSPLESSGQLLKLPVDRNWHSVYLEVGWSVDLEAG